MLRWWGFEHGMKFKKTHKIHSNRFRQPLFYYLDCLIRLLPYTISVFNFYSMPVKKNESIVLPEAIAPKKNLLSLTHILLIIVILFQSCALYLLTGNSVPSFGDITIDPLGIKRAVLEIEYDKVGGKTNYDIMTRAQQLSVNDPQNPSNIANMKKYVESFS